MSIEPIKGMRGQEQALCKCDTCAAEETVSARHGTSKPGRPEKGGWRHLTLQNEGEVTAKLQASGWGLVKGKLYCPKCNAKRKEEKPVAVVTEIRTPTREQKRQIMDLLSEVYDEKAGRYRGSETDVTVAETIGGGVMFGWVAELRCEFFGESGENEEAEDIMGEVAKWREAADAIAADMSSRLTEFNAARAKVAEIEKRMASFVKTMGPRR